MIEAVEFRWSGQVMKRSTGSPSSAGRRTDEPNVYVATGDSGHGHDARHDRRHAAPRPDPRPRQSVGALYDPSRLILRALPALVRENLNVAAQYADWLTPAEVSSAEEIPPGQGARAAARPRQDRGLPRRRGTAARALRGLPAPGLHRRLELRGEDLGLPVPRLALRRARARHQRTGEHRPGASGGRANESTVGDRPGGGWIGASIAMAWTLSVQAQGGATTGAPPRMPPAPAKSSYAPVVEEPFETVVQAHERGQGRGDEAPDGPARRALRPGRPRRRRRRRCRAASRSRTACACKLPGGRRPGTSSAAMTPEEIREQGRSSRRASCRCRTPTTPKAACSSRSSTSTRSRSRTAATSTRFDLDFDLPDHFLPEFPPPIFLTTRPDLGDVSQGQARHDRQLLRALQRHPEPEAARGPAAAGDAVPAAAVQPDRRPPQRASRSRGVACFDCHVNGHTNGATHLVGDIRPQEFRHRIDTPSLRGVNIQRLFGSQRALKTRRGLHRVRAARRLLRRRPGDRHEEGRQHPRARQPGPLHGRVPGAARLPARARSSTSIGKLDPTKASDAGAARPGAVLRQGAVRDLPPGAVLHRQHDAQPAGRALLQAADDQRHAWPSADGPIKTFPLRGIKDSPPYLHDGRLLTLEDTVEFFNLVLGIPLTTAEKEDLVAFLRAL